MKPLAILTLLLSCSVNSAVLEYDTDFDPQTHTEPGVRTDVLDLDSWLDYALASHSGLSYVYGLYRSKYGVSHGNHETTDRLRIFREYLVRARSLRESSTISWNVGLTTFAHRTQCEKSLLKMGNKTDHLDFFDTTSPCQKDYHFLFDDDSNGLMSGGLTPAPTFDWRAYGAVTPVKDQEDTPNCWAFAAVTVMEAWLMRLTGDIDELSTQELSDCVYYGKKDHFIGGGWPHHAWDHVKNEGRIGYRYQIPERLEGNAGSCNYGWAKNALQDFGVEVEKVASLKGKATTAEDYMLIINKFSPIAVIIKPDDDLTDFYVGGPYDPRLSTQCATAEPHAVAIVGYDQKYFYIKNSWGPDWGHSGYVWWIRAKGTETCGLYNHASVVQMRTKYQLEEKKE